MTTDVMNFLATDLTVANYRCYSDAHPLQLSFRSDTRTIAIVGPNNSGKTSALRFFYDLRDVFRTIVNPNERHGDSVIARKTGTFNFPQDEPDITNIFHKYNDRPMVIKLRIHSQEPKQEIRLTITVARNSNAFTMDAFFDPRLTTESGNSKQILIPVDIFLLFYPTIRSLHETIYFNSYRHALNNSGGRYFDLSVGSDITRAWSELKTGGAIDDWHRSRYLEKMIRDIFSYREFGLEAEHKKQYLLATVDDMRYPLHTLGSGISQFIMMLLAAATSKPSWILVDEPEINLHATLQHKLITSLLSLASRGVIFSTHSLGLARVSADTVLTSAPEQSDKKAVELRPFTEHSRLAEILGELSFAAFRDLGFRALLLVEGPTEIRAIEPFLREYGIHSDVVMIPLCGSSMINASTVDQLLEIRRICDTIYCLIDSERQSPDAAIDKSRESFLKNCKAAGIRAMATERRAFENYFSEAAIQKTFGSQFKSLGPYERINTGNCRWSKTDNWRITSNMRLADLTNTDIGRFLEELSKEIRKTCRDGSSQ